MTYSTFFVACLVFMLLLCLSLLDEAYARRKRKKFDKRFTSALDLTAGIAYYGVKSDDGQD